MQVSATVNITIYFRQTEPFLLHTVMWTTRGVSRRDIGLKWCRLVDGDSLWPSRGLFSPCDRSWSAVRSATESTMSDAVGIVGSIGSTLKISAKHEVNKTKHWIDCNHMDFVNWVSRLSSTCYCELMVNCDHTENWDGNKACHTTVLTFGRFLALHGYTSYWADVKSLKFGSCKWKCSGVYTAFWFNTKKLATFLCRR